MISSFHPCHSATAGTLQHTATHSSTRLAHFILLIQRVSIEGVQQRDNNVCNTLQRVQYTATCATAICTTHCNVCNTLQRVQHSGVLQQLQRTHSHMICKQRLQQRTRLILTKYSPIPIRWNSKCSSNANRNPRWSNFMSLFRWALQKETLDTMVVASRISVCIPITIWSLMFSCSTGLNLLHETKF